MPEEVMVLAFVSILAGTGLIIFLIWAIISYLKSRSAGVQGTSLTASELQQLMRQAVEEATLPLAEKIEALEERLEALPPREGPPVKLLEEADEADLRQGAAPPVRQPAGRR